MLALVGTGALSSGELSEWIDAEILRRREPPRWLLDASLATSPEDKLHHLRLVPAALEMSRDPFLILHTSLLAYRRGRIGPERLAGRALNTTWDHSLPGDLKAAIYELDEDATCAHEYGGQPQPERVAESVARLEACLAAHGKWRTLCEACAGA